MSAGLFCSSETVKNGQTCKLCRERQEAEPVPTTFLSKRAAVSEIALTP